jgi:hypothetical protein
VTRLHNVSGVDKILSNGVPGDKPGLVRVDHIGHQRLKVECKTFGLEFKAIVLQGIRAKVIRSIGTNLLLEGEQ